MAKYSMLRERVAADGICGPGELRTPRAVTDEEILRAHAPALPGARGLGDAYGQGDAGASASRGRERMVERSRRASGGTLGACLAALEEGFAANLAGGTHHAFSDRGEGYCVFNDSAIAARAVQAAGLAERVVVIDTDVHQGNGTARDTARGPVGVHVLDPRREELPLPQRGERPRRAPPRRHGRHRVPGSARKGSGDGARGRGCRPRHLPCRRRPVRGRPPRPALGHEDRPGRARQDGPGSLPGPRHPGRGNDGRRLRAQTSRTRWTCTSRASNARPTCWEQELPRTEGRANRE